MTEHLICLNRGEEDTGHVWFERAIAQLAALIRLRRSERKNGEADGENRQTATDGQGGRLQVHVWWGSDDKMVPRQGQGALILTLLKRSHRSRGRVAQQGFPGIS
jgi:hypothetical protein